METLIVKPKNRKQLTAIKAFLKALDVSFRKDDEKSLPNPSPSGDKWFLDPKNIEEVEKGMADVKAGRFTHVKKEDLKSLLGL